MGISMCRVPQLTDHDPNFDRVFAETVAEITRLTEQARKRGRPKGTTGIPRNGERARLRLADRVRHHGEASERLLHVIELREQMERAREDKSRRHRMFLVGQAVVRQMEVNPALHAAMMRLLDDAYAYDDPRKSLGLRCLTAEEKRARKQRR